jgi:hypothetical protein
MSTNDALMQPITAPRCHCEHPLLDGETCHRCGRFPASVSPEAPRAAPGRTAWTRAGVVRVVRAFMFFRGRTPERDDWSTPMGPEWPPLDVVEELFGSLDTLLLVSRSTSQP